MTNEYLAPSLSVPTLDHAGGVYRVRWSGNGEDILMTFRDFDAQGKNIEAELTIYDYGETSPRLTAGNRVFITKPFIATLRELEATSLRPPDEWIKRFMQAVTLVQEAYRTGEPVVSLGAMAEPEPMVPVLGNILMENTPTVLYGPGGIGKSIVGLSMMSAIHTGRAFAGLEVVQSNAMVLDWETDAEQTYRRNRAILEGQGIDPGIWADPQHPDSQRTGMLYYKPMIGPLWDSSESLYADIRRLGVHTLLIDSAGPACGGKLENADETMRFFTALRSLSSADHPVQSIIIAHVTHEVRRRQKTSAAFGSVYWTNFPRNSYELVASPDIGITEFALHHRKSNLGGLRTPLGFQMEWDNNYLVTRINPFENALLRAGMPLGDQIVYLVKKADAVHVNGSAVPALTAEQVQQMLPDAPSKRDVEVALKTNIHLSRLEHLGEEWWVEKGGES